MTRTLQTLLLIASASLAAGALPRAQPSSTAITFETADPACQKAQLVSTGAQFPKDRRTLAVRWTGYSNFELAYSDQIILLDAYFDRGSAYPPLGFKAADVRRADVILLGHGHFDHMSDAAAVAAKTGAVVVAAPVTVEQLEKQALDRKQIRTVTGRGGEVLSFKGVTIEPILGRHGEPPPEVTRAFNQALRSITTPISPEEAAVAAAIRARGTSDPRITEEGTIAYLITLDDGFRIMYRDSGGRITDYEKTAMQRVGRVDVALAAVAADVLDSLTSRRALEFLRTYRPDVYIPAHHDADRNGMWRPTEPIFQALKEEDPKLITISKQYREPICFDTENNVQRGKWK
jgi:L-ascorbate metabolism protein UlaG (beta-lactamase superfamily)